MWKPVTLRGNVSDRIKEQITDLIACDELKAGDRLPAERELAGLLGVSRPSVREAVKSLAAQGRLHVRHGQGVFVAMPRSEQDLRAAMARDEIDVDELFAMREVLEVPASGWAAEKGDRTSLARVAAALRELNQAIQADAPDFRLLQILDAAFHMRIGEAAGNRFLRQTLGVLQDILTAGMETTLMVPGRLERSRTEHERILSALQAGDPRAARNATRHHIRAAHTTALRRLGHERADGGVVGVKN